MPNYTITAPDHETEPITKLLRDETTDNTLLVLRLIQGGGVPPSKRITGYLFGIAVFHSDPETAGLANLLLRRHAQTETVRQAEKLRASAPYYYNEAEYLGKYENPEIDLFDFLLAYKMCSWHAQSFPRAAYFILSHQTLNLSYFPYDALTPAFANLNFISFLTLPNNKNFNLEASLPFLAQLPLEALILDGMRLETFPVMLFQLQKLRTLTIRRGNSRPRLPVLVPDGGPYGSPSLEKLVIDSYPISGEDRLGPFPNLRDVLITRCGLRTMNWLKPSTFIESLVLKSNQFFEVPDFIGNFRRLKTLDLSLNPLRRINLDLRNLPELETLDLKTTYIPGQHF